MADNTISEQDLQDEILLKVLESDESALTDMLCHYAPKIENALASKYRNILNNADIEDVISIAVMKFWNMRETYDDQKGSIRAFFYRIADNTAKDILKYGWHKAKRMEQVAEKDFIEQSLIIQNHLNQPASNDDNPTESKKLEALKKVLATLSEIQRNILLADAMADGTADSAELGERFGGHPAATIRQYRMRAGKALRDGMKKLGFEIPES